MNSILDAIPSSPLSASRLRVPSPSPLFIIPPGDGAAFARLPETVRNETHLTLARLKQIHHAKNKTAEAERISAHLQRLLNTRRGASAATLIRQYYTYTAYGKKVGAMLYPAGDWRTVVDWAKAGPASRLAPDSDSLPPEFIQLWRKLCDQHQRVTSEAYRELIEIYDTGFDRHRNRVKSIPGYPTWPEPDPNTGKPQGWTQRNLYRYAPDKFELTAARQGIQAAMAVGLKLRTSRVGLRCGEQVEFDDHECDVKINFPGQLSSFRPRGFGSLDCLTTAAPLLVFKPTLWDTEAGAKQALTEVDFMWFVIAYLTEIGFRKDTGTILKVEHGTAAIRGDATRKLGDALRDDFEARIWEATGHLVTVGRSGRAHQPAHGGQFAAPSGGNPRFKRLQELYWRLLNDRLDSLPGQVGMQRLAAPEEMEKADAYNNRLLRAAGAMEPERAAELILPRLLWPEFLEYVWHARDAIHNDPDHAIQGWDACGFLTREIRSAPNLLDWRPASGAGIPAGDSCFRVRRLTRWEAFQKHRSELTPLGYDLIPLLAGRRHCIKCKGTNTLTVRQGIFEFEDWRISSDPLLFIAQDASGNRLREGEKFMCFVNPMSPSRLVACDAAGRVVSVCPPMPVPAHNDTHAVERSMGLQRSWFARALAEQRERHQPDAASLAFMKAHNAAILAGNQTPAEKQRARSLRHTGLQTETLLDDSADSAPSAPRETQPQPQFNPESLL